MRRILAIVLLIAGIVLAAYAVEIYREATTQVEFIGIDITAANEEKQQTAIIYVALSLISLTLSFLAWKGGRK